MVYGEDIKKEPDKHQDNIHYAKEFGEEDMDKGKRFAKMTGVTFERLVAVIEEAYACLLYTSPSPRD
eukprot:7333385-Alexandrium_andersonii.AAC.1